MCPPYTWRSRPACPFAPRDTHADHGRVVHRARRRRGDPSRERVTLVMLERSRYPTQTWLPLALWDTQRSAGEGLPEQRFQRAAGDSPRSSPSRSQSGRVLQHLSTRVEFPSRLFVFCIVFFWYFPFGRARARNPNCSFHRPIHQQVAPLSLSRWWCLDLWIRLSLGWLSLSGTCRGFLMDCLVSGLIL